MDLRCELVDLIELPKYSPMLDFCEHSDELLTGQESSASILQGNCITLYAW
jgi:hypothetical protein